MTIAGSEHQQDEKVDRFERTGGRGVGGRAARMPVSNVTSPTGFVEISQQTGFDVAEAFAQALENSVRAR